jgi:tRNA-specific 2-thiouridylase
MIVKKSKKRVLVGLSGGIDSAVSAWKLLQDGYEVEAVFMKNWSSTKGLKYDECPWLQDRQDALRVAAFLKIPMHTLDFEKEYEEAVLNYFFESYEKGLTPNPDVMCNKEIKFKLLYNWAMEKGFDFLATGHYAQIMEHESCNMEHEKNKKNTLTPLIHDSCFMLCRSKDEFKDQTYFIYNIRGEQLGHLMFPVGGMMKKDVRALAQKIGLPNADKKESMGLCFVGKIRLKDFLEQKVKLVPGNIIDAGTGKVLGQHKGLPNYTIGQREGVAVGGGEALYVVRKDLEKNELVVSSNADDPLLMRKEVLVGDVHWIDANSPQPSLTLREGEKTRLLGRYRHQGELVGLFIEKIDEKICRVIFDEEQKAIASGQSLVFYDGEVCLGGGVVV